MRLHSSGLRVALAFFLATTVCAAARAQTDIALSAYGAFSNTTTGNAVKEIPSDSAGGMIELRHIVNPLVGFEATYAFNRASQVYKPSGFCSLCSPIFATVSEDAHEITGDWVFSSHARKLRPFALVGVGLLYYRPLKATLFDSPATAQGYATPVYVYGAGIDWAILSHIGLRLQYRGNFHNAPDPALTTAEVPGVTTYETGFAHTAEPAIGIYYKF